MQESRCMPWCPHTDTGSTNRYRYATFTQA